MRWLAIGTAVALLASEAAHATPIVYGFTAGPLLAVGTQYYDGRFSYDPDTGIGSLEFHAPIDNTLSLVDLGSSGSVSLPDSTHDVLHFGWLVVYEVWPPAPSSSIFEYHSAQLDLRGLVANGLFTGDQLAHGLTLADFGPGSISLSFFRSSVDGPYSPTPYQLGCPEGTPLYDCPRDTFHFYRDSIDYPFTLVDLHEIPEPRAEILVFAGSILLISLRRRAAFR